MSLRPARTEELPAIHRMGFDKWGGSQSWDDYLAECLAKPKYARGQRLAWDEDGELAASVMVYREDFELLPGCWGLGSLTTAPAFRRRGIAGRLLATLIEQARHEGRRGLYLFSDIDPAYYARSGFEFIEAQQPDDVPPCMVLAFRDEFELKQSVPTFF